MSACVGVLHICEEGIYAAAGAGFSNVRPRRCECCVCFFEFSFFFFCKTGCSARATLNSASPSGLYGV